MEQSQCQVSTQFCTHQNTHMTYSKNLSVIAITRELITRKSSSKCFELLYD